MNNRALMTAGQSLLDWAGYVRRETQTSPHHLATHLQRFGSAVRMITNGEAKGLSNTDEEISLSLLIRE